MIWQQIAVKARRRLARARIARDLRTAPFALAHPSAVVSRRAGDFTCNFYGVFGRGTESVRYTLNGGAEADVRRGQPRVPAREFVVELGADELAAGRNRLELIVSGKGAAGRRVVHEFDYDPAPPKLPFEIRWDPERIEVGDGIWEVIDREGVPFIRPRSGHEGYDRSVFAAGAFGGGRRIETSLVYRTHAAGRPFGFGLHPLWGGRPDDENVSPRGGWRFSFAGYYSRHGGAGMEFSTCAGGRAPDWVGVYRNFEPQADREYRLVVEVLQERDARGTHAGYRQRMRLAEPGQADTGAWLELSDRQGVPLPEAEYGVAILAHNCQVEFGPLTVSALPATSAEAEAYDDALKRTGW